MSSKGFSVCLVLVLAIVFACAAPVVEAADIHVPADRPTIQEAINAANNGDVIIVADGTYAGDNNKNLDFGGKTITLRSAGGAQNCIIDCENSGRGFYFHSDETSESVVEGFTIRNGNAPENGGGIYFRRSSPTIINCIIENNSASNSGGGIYCHSANPTFINCLIAGNSAGDNGGGIYCQQADPVLTNCTIAGNSAGSWGGGIWCHKGDVVMNNTIIWGNSASAGGNQVRLLNPSKLVLNYCDYANGAKDMNIKGELITSHCITDNPLFAAAQAGDYHLYPSSPCVDAGDNSLVLTQTDLDGKERIFDGDLDDTDTVDMGAYEFQPIIHVDVTDGDDDNDGFSWATAVWTIQRGIDIAIEHGGHGWTVLVADGTYTGTGNKDLDFHGFAIHLKSAGDAESCIIDCEGTDRGVYFRNSEAEDTIVEGFTIRNGSADYGGAILCEWNSRPTITNCIIAYNSADMGGGIYCTDTWYGEGAAIIECTVTNNTANRGAGIYCSWSAEPLIIDCTIANNSVPWGDGGGIFCESDSSPTIADCRIADNSADRGSGIYCDMSSIPIITNCTITGNQQSDTGYSDGGGIYCEYNSTPTITDCTITGNFAHNGGGIFCSGTWLGEGALIADCTIANNTANYGAGIYCSWSANPIITNCTIADNEVPWGEGWGEGGGIYCNGGSIPIVANCDITGNSAYMGGGGILCGWNSNPTIINCSISNNTSNGYGAGISCNNSNPVITNCIINGNSTTNTGAAINCHNSSPVLTNCLIAGNSAHNGAGFASFWYSQPTVNNCIIAGNTAEYRGGGVYCFNANFTANNTIIWGNSANTANEIWTGGPWETVVVRLNNCCYPDDNNGGDNGGNIEGSGTVIPVNCIHDDPLFVDATGGDYHLQGASPCIGAGDNSYIPDGVTEDLDGNPRVIGLAVDMGAYEYSAIIYVDGTNGDNANDGLSWATALKTIQAGLDLAGNRGWTVLVADGTYAGTGNKNLDFNGKLIYLKAERIHCTGIWIIDCQDEGRGFYFHNGETGAAVVEGFTIQNGNFVDENGGGILCENSSSPTITNCIITNNTVRDFGGGIYCEDSNPTITNCIIANNSTEYYPGGGIFCFRSSPAITGCTITGNETASWGAGIFCYANSNPSIINCTIANNSARDGGGIVCLYNSSPTITNCTVANNSAEVRYGGIDIWENSSPAITNCVIVNNSAGLDCGGINCYENSSPVITNCTIADNSAGRDGGGITCWLSTPTLNNTILWGNSAEGQGNQIYTFDPASNVTLNYCDYANGDNDIAGTGTVTPSHCKNDDPLFVNVADADYHLLNNSPCIDAGDNSLIPAGILTDLDGNDRILNGDNIGTATVDMGAYELIYNPIALPVIPDIVVRYYPSYSDSEEEIQLGDLNLTNTLTVDLRPFSSHANDDYLVGWEITGDYDTSLLNLEIVNDDQGKPFLLRITPVQNTVGETTVTLTLKDNLGNMRSVQVTIRVVFSGSEQDAGIVGGGAGPAHIAAGGQTQNGDPTTEEAHSVLLYGYWAGHLGIAEGIEESDGQASVWLVFRIFDDLADGDEQYFNGRFLHVDFDDPQIPEETQPDDTGDVDDDPSKGVWYKYNQSTVEAQTGTVTDPGTGETFDGQVLANYAKLISGSNICDNVRVVFEVYVDETLVISQSVATVGINGQPDTQSGIDIVPPADTWYGKTVYAYDKNADTTGQGVIDDVGLYLDVDHASLGPEPVSGHQVRLYYAPWDDPENRIGLGTHDVVDGFLDVPDIPVVMPGKYLITAEDIRVDDPDAAPEGYIVYESPPIYVVDITVAGYGIDVNGNANENNVNGTTPAEEGGRFPVLAEMVAPDILDALAVQTWIMTWLDYDDGTEAVIEVEDNGNTQTTFQVITAPSSPTSGEFPKITAILALSFTYLKRNGGDLSLEYGAISVADTQSVSVVDNPEVDPPTAYITMANGSSLTDSVATDGAFQARVNVSQSYSYEDWQLTGENANCGSILDDDTADGQATIVGTMPTQAYEPGMELTCSVYDDNDNLLTTCVAPGGISVVNESVPGVTDENLLDDGKRYFAAGGVNVAGDVSAGAYANTIDVMSDAEGASAAALYQAGKGALVALGNESFAFLACVVSAVGVEMPFGQLMYASPLVTGVTPGPDVDPPVPPVNVLGDLDGWTHKYNILAWFEGGDEVFTILTPSAHRIRFRKESDNVYKSSRVRGKDAQVTLEQGRWCYQSHAGTQKIYFEGSTSTEQEFYDYTNTWTYYRVFEVQDNNGKSIDMEYDPNNCLTKVTEYRRTEPEAGSSNGVSFKLEYSQNPGNITSVYMLDKTGQPVPSKTVALEYDEFERLTRVTYPAGVSNGSNDDTYVQITYYDDTGSLHEMRDRGGRIHSFSYDPGTGWLTRYTAPDGSETGISSVETKDTVFATLTTTKDGNVVDERTLVVSRANNEIISTTNALGETTTYNYASDDPTRLESVVDSEGWTRMFEYDPQNNLTGIVDESGTETSITYNGLNLPETITREDSQTYFIYDSNGNLVTRRDQDPGLANGGPTVYTETRYAYDAWGKLESVTRVNPDGEDQLTEFEYDPVTGVLTRQIVRHNESETNYEYDSALNVSKVTDPNGNISVYLYDDLNRLAKEYPPVPDDLTTPWREEPIIGGMPGPESPHYLYAYDLSSNLVAKKDLLNRWTYYQFSDQNYQNRVVDAEGYVQVYQYEGENLVLSCGPFKPDLGAPSLQEHIKRLVDPNNPNYVYDNELIFEHSDGHYTTYAYDDANRLTQVTNAAGDSMYYEHGGGGNVIRTTDFRGFATDFRYDEQDRLVLTRDAYGNEVTYEYDGQSNLIRMVDKNDNVFNYHYDSANRLTLVEMPEGVCEKYYYNGLNQLVCRKGPYDSTAGEDSSSIESYFYDGAGRMVTKQQKVDYSTTYTTHYHYDNNGNLILLEPPRDGSWPGDPVIVKTKFEYDHRNRNTRIYPRFDNDIPDPDKDFDPTYYEEFTYDEMGNVLSRRDLNSYVTTYEYDDVYRLTKELDPEDASQVPPLAFSRKFTFGKFGKIEEVEDSKNNVTSYQYDIMNRLSLRENALGYIWEMTYDANGNQLARRDARYNWTYFEYDRLNRLTKSTTPEGIITMSEYDANGNLVASSDGRNVTRFVHDALNRVTGITFAEENITVVYEYDARSNRTFAYGPWKASGYNDYDHSGVAGLRVDQYIYDLLSRVTEVHLDLNGEDAQAKYYYDANSNRISTETLAETGKWLKSEFEYNEMDRLTRSILVHDDTGHDEIVAFDYDMAGNLVTRIVDPGVANGYLNLATVFTYDKVYNLSTVTNPENETITYHYDSENNLTRVKDAEQKATAYKYDECYFLTRIDRGLETDDATESDNHTIFEYDGNGNRTKVNAHWNKHGIEYQATTYEYDNDDRLITRIDARCNTEHFTYDASNNLETYTDAKCQITRFHHDRMNRLITKQHFANSGSLEAAVEYTYDEFSRVLTVTEAGNTDLEFIYDNLGRMLTKRNNLLGREIRYVYDRAGRRIQLQVFSSGLPEGDTLSYIYDDASRMKEAHRISAAFGDVTEAAYDYDLAGRVDFATYGNGCTTDYIYDNASRLLTIENTGPAGIISKFVYGYDDVGNRETLEYTNGATVQNITYDYDEVYRLTSEARSEGANTVYSQSFTYDLLGNRETKNVTVNDPSIEELHTGDWIYTCNELNQLLTETEAGMDVWQYDYDLNGSLTRKYSSTEENIYGYDARNRMVSVELPSSDVWEYTYDSFGRRIEKHLNGVDQAQRYLYDGDNVVMDYEFTESTQALTAKAMYNTPGLDSNLSAHKFGETDEVLWYMTGGLGSIRNMVDDSGAVTRTMDYDAWGVNLGDEPQDPTERYNFTGRELDPETGLHYYRARYYNAHLGKLIQLDKVDSLNRYSYCRSNPTFFKDPYGLQDNPIIERPLAEEQRIQEARKALGIPANDSGNIVSKTTVSFLTGGMPSQQESWEDFLEWCTADKKRHKRISDLASLNAELVDAFGGADELARISKSLEEETQSIWNMSCSEIEKLIEDIDLLVPYRGSKNRLTLTDAPGRFWIPAGLLKTKEAQQRELTGYMRTTLRELREYEWETPEGQTDSLARVGLEGEELKKRMTNFASQRALGAQIDKHNNQAAIQRCMLDRKKIIDELVGEYIAGRGKGKGAVRRGQDIAGWIAIFWIVDFFTAHLGDYVEATRHAAKVEKALKAAKAARTAPAGAAGTATRELSKAAKGELGELRGMKAVLRVGYDDKTCRLAGNRGFDSVFVKYGKNGDIKDILIIESKYSGAGRSAKSLMSETQTMGKQMSEKWIHKNIQKMLSSTDDAVRQTGELLDANKNLIRGKVNVLDKAGVNRWTTINYGK